MENNGHFTWRIGNVEVSSGGITNNPAGIFTVALDCCNQYYTNAAHRTLTGLGSFDNYGTVTTGGSWPGRIVIPFNNNGTATTDSTVLYVSNGGYSSGMFEPAASVPIVFESGESVLDPLSQITGSKDSAVQVSGGTLNVYSTFTNNGGYGFHSNDAP